MGSVVSEQARRRGSQEWERKSINLEVRMLSRTPAVPETKAGKGRCPDRARKAKVTTISLTNDKGYLQPQLWSG